MVKITKNEKLKAGQDTCIKFQSMPQAETCENNQVKCTFTTMGKTITWVTAARKLDKLKDEAISLGTWLGILKGKLKVISPTEFQIDHPGMQIFKLDKLDPTLEPVPDKTPTDEENTPPRKVIPTRIVKITKNAVLKKNTLTYLQFYERIPHVEKVAGKSLICSVVWKHKQIIWRTNQSSVEKMIAKARSFEVWVGVVKGFLRHVSANKIRLLGATMEVCEGKPHEVAETIGMIRDRIIRSQPPEMLYTAYKNPSENVIIKTVSSAHFRKLDPSMVRSRRRNVFRNRRFIGIVENIAVPKQAIKKPELPIPKIDRIERLERLEELGRIKKLEKREKPRIRRRSTKSLKKDPEPGKVLEVILSPEPPKAIVVMPLQETPVVPPMPPTPKVVVERTRKVKNKTIIVREQIREEPIAVATPPAPAPPRPKEPTSDIGKECFRLMKEGHSDEEIAKIVGRSPNLVWVSLFGFR